MGEMEKDAGRRENLAILNVKLLLSEPFKRSCYHILQVITLHEMHRENCQIVLVLLVGYRDLLLDSSPHQANLCVGAKKPPRGQENMGSSSWSFWLVDDGPERKSGVLHHSFVPSIDKI